MFHALLAGTAPIINITPNASGVPGGNALLSLLGGLMWAAFAICIVGIILSAIFMAVGKHSSNGRLHDQGRSGLLAAIIGAALCGGCAAIVTFFFNLGSTIH
jgi:uncharacterized membrane protein YhaH (DUF805 family)